MVLIKFSLLEHPENEEAVYKILHSLFSTDCFVSINGDDPEKELNAWAKKELEKIGEHKFIEEYCSHS